MVKRTHGVSVQTVCNSNYDASGFRTRRFSTTNSYKVVTGAKFEYFGALQCQRIFAVSAPDDMSHNRFWWNDDNEGNTKILGTEKWPHASSSITNPTDYPGNEPRSP